jgi:hypothetical protein
VTPGPVWFDFENSPHVLFLEPILRYLEDEGIPTVCTAKPQSQTLELAEARGIEVTVVGEGNLKGRVRKIAHGLGRAAQLGAWIVRSQRPALLVSSSRSASVAARWLGLPAVGVLDYEHAECRPFAHGCREVLLPDLLRDALLPRSLRRIATFFEGLKENLYIDALGLDRATARAAHGIARDEYMVVARPPATNAHYAERANESAEIWLRLVRRLHEEWGASVQVFPRDAEQKVWLRAELGGLPRVHVPEQALDGPAMIAASDLVLSAGGTMNREAAALGVPAWSVFTGPAPFIDMCLEQEGRLRWARTEQEVDYAWWAGRPGLLERRGPYPAGLETILDAIHCHLGVPRPAAGGEARVPAEVRR